MPELMTFPIGAGQGVRLNYYGSSVGAKFSKYINSAGKVVSDSAVPASTLELVKIRASQINALELAEQGTRIADAAGGVTDEAWANAAKHYDDEQLAALVSIIALINSYNRMNVIIKQPAGDYQPGQLG
jgi:alkylhydroperoxidase family enzyme